MKRLLIRISVLATIVALGLIAIAQAQRGVSEPSQAADTSQASKTPISEGAPPPITPTFTPETAPRELPSGMPANPLRSGSQQPFNTGLRPTTLSAEANTNNAQQPATSAVHPTNQPAIRRVANPFGDPPSAASPQPTSYPTNQTAYGAPAGPALASGQESVGNVEVVAAANGPDPNLAPPAQDGSGGYTLPTEPPPFGAAASSPVAATDPSAGMSQAGTQQPGIVSNESIPAATAPSSAPMFSSPTEPQKIGSATEQATPIGAAPSTASSLGQGTGTPGEAQLEGPQAPQLTIQKSAPPEIQVGKPAKFQVTVRNTGNIAAQNVEIRDEVPRGAQLVTTNPRAAQGVRGDLVWSLGSLRPGEEASVEMEVMPVAEGEIGSVATVTFNAAASAKSIATRPQLAIRTVAPRQVLIGEEVVLAITISNPGSGVATGVILEERVPPGLQHAAGGELEYDVGTLKPNESRQLELRLVATQAGSIINTLSARGANNLRTEERVQVDVLAPQLQVNLDGPKRRYLEREAVYTVMVSNPGTAPARQVELVAQLPTGMKFVNANNAGSYDENTQTVHWLLDELPVNETGSVQLTTVPVVAGEQTIRIQGTAEQGLQTQQEHSVLVEGIAAILFEVVDVADPIEVNGETTYEIRVVNQGSKAATNVQLVAQLPPGMRFVAAEGPTRHTPNGNTVYFEALSRLAPKADTTFRVRAQGLQPGDQRIRVQLQADELQPAVTKEESTRVYSDG